MTYETVMATLETSLQAALPARTVQRGMVLDPASLKAVQLTAGVLCLVSQGGGGFLNYQGREGDGGDMDVTVVGFVSVAERDATYKLEQAEFALIEDVLTFCKGIGMVGPLDAVVPQSWQQSGQLEHPFGWVTMKLKVRWL